MAKSEPVNPQTTQLPRLLTWRDALTIVIAGAVVGLVTLAVYFMLDKYVFTPGLCGGANVDPVRCESKAYFSSTLAMIIGGIGGLFALVQQRVYRPLLVVLLVVVGLWNIVLLFGGATWWMSALLSGLVFAVSYLAFSWLVQLRNFYLALGVSALVVVLMRLILMS